MVQTQHSLNRKQSRWNLTSSKNTWTK